MRPLSLLLLTLCLTGCGGSSSMNLSLRIALVAAEGMVEIAVMEMPDEELNSLADLTGEAREITTEIADVVERLDDSVQAEIARRAPE